MPINDSIHVLMSTVQTYMEELGVELDCKDLESIVFLLYYSLKPYGRYFHSIDHALDLTIQNNPEISLAALFHDLIYYQIDRGFNNLVEPIVRQVVREEKREAGQVGKVFLLNDFEKSDLELHINLNIFGLHSGQELSPYAGLNEFLSSLVMTRTLSPYLSIKKITQMIVFIEGTIPFRGKGVDQRDYFYQLSEKLQETNRLFDLGFTPQEISQTIREAVALSNRDVMNFSEEDTRDFLDNTWDLIPETNVSLRSNELYTIKDYRIAIEKMDNFFTYLDPLNIFHQYENVPSTKELEEINQRAAHNLSISRIYLKVKYITAVILEAFAEESGGDCPICYFMGELPREDEKIKRLETYLPEVCGTLIDDRNPLVWQLLDQGRNRESSFDIKHAPLSLFLYAECNDNELSELYHFAKQMTNQHVSPELLINSLPSRIRVTIARSLSEMAPSRKAILSHYLS